MDWRLNACLEAVDYGAQMEVWGPPVGEPNQPCTVIFHCDEDTPWGVGWDGPCTFETECMSMPDLITENCEPGQYYEFREEVLDRSMSGSGESSDSEV